VVQILFSALVCFSPSCIENIGLVEKTTDFVNEQKIRMHIESVVKLMSVFHNTCMANL